MTELKSVLAKGVPARQTVYDFTLKTYTWQGLGSCASEDKREIAHAKLSLLAQGIEVVCELVPQVGKLYQVSLFLSCNRKICWLLRRFVPIFHFDRHSCLRIDLKNISPLLPRQPHKVRPVVWCDIWGILTYRRIQLVDSKDFDEHWELIFIEILQKIELLLRLGPIHRGQY